MKKKILLMSILSFGALAATEEPQIYRASVERTEETREAPALQPRADEVKNLAERGIIHQQFGYASMGLGPFPIPLPVFGLGYRTQTGHHGIDLSLQTSTVVIATAVKANILYLHYFKPSYTSEFYAGGGISPGVLLGLGNRAFISPEFVVGKQYRNESDDLRFFQMQVSFPTFSQKSPHHHRIDILDVPLVVFSYGLGF